MKQFTSKSQKSGQIGEQVARTFLVRNGFSIIDQNYTKRFGEIDIIAKKDNILYFIEVKSRNKETFDSNLSNQEMFSFVSEMVTPKKLERFKKTIEIYLTAGSSEKTMFKVLAVLVIFDDLSRKAKIKTQEII